MVPQFLWLQRLELGRFHVEKFVSNIYVEEKECGLIE